MHETVIFQLPLLNLTSQSCFCSWRRLSTWPRSGTERTCHI